MPIPDPQRDLARRLEILRDQREHASVNAMLDGMRERRYEPKRKTARLTATIAALALATACTTKPDVTVEIDKGAVQVAAPEIDFTAPVTLVIQRCDGGVSVIPFGNVADAATD